MNLSLPARIAACVCMVLIASGACADVDDGDSAYARALALEQHPDRALALQAAARAVELRRAEHATAALLAASLQLLAGAQLQIRDNVGASASATEVLRLAPETLDAARAHIVLSSVAMRSSQLDLAGNELSRAQNIIERIAPASLDAAILLSRLAVLSALRREGDAATAAYAHALTELRRLAPGTMLLGRIAFNAHLHALERRRYSEAESLAREAMMAFAAAVPDSLEFSQARAALAEVLMRRTEYAQAEVLLRAAVQASDQVDARSYEALSLKLQLGDSLVRQARFADALLLYDELNDVLSAPDAPPALAGTSLLADAALYRGEVLARLDRCTEAIASAEQALLRYVAQQRPGSQRWEAHLLLSDCRRRGGDVAAAIDHAQQAITGFRAIAADGIQEAQAQFALARALRDSGAMPAAITAYGAAIDGLEHHRERVGASDEIRARWAAQFQDFYKELLWLLARDGDVAAVLDIEARYRVQALLQLLGDDQADLAGAWATREAPRAAAAVLPPDSALLSFVVTAQGTLAIVRRPGTVAAKTFALPATRTTLATQVDRMLLLGARVNSDPIATDALDQVGHQLHAALIAPLRAELADYPRWIIVADGPLRQLPWAALVVSLEPRPRYLIEERVLSVAPSAPAWAVLAERQHGPQQILAFADSGSDVADGDAQRATAGVALPGARREVAALDATYPGRVTSYLGKAATEAQVRRAAPSAGMIHFALHSVTDARAPMASYIALARGDDHRAEDDGRLHADEIARELQLQADVVVLSSCASALGTEAGGEGLFGLIRALHLAGARAVIGTTWPVDDNSTARLMGDFYRHRNAGLDSDSALTHAQRDWLATARADSWRDAIARFFGVSDTLPEHAEHPFYWAAFVHSGAAAR